MTVVSVESFPESWLTRESKLPSSCEMQTFPQYAPVAAWSWRKPFVSFGERLVSSWTRSNPPKKQIVSSRSFGQAVTELSDLQDAVAHFISNAAGKLRKQHSVGGLLQVFFMTDRFRPEKPQYNPCLSVPLTVPTADSLELNRWVFQTLEQMYRPGFEYKKAGVMLADIRPDHIIQENLFSAGESIPKAELMKTLDRINARYGRGTLKLSSDGAHGAWEMKAGNKSPSYTTDWDQIAQ